MNCMERDAMIDDTKELAEQQNEELVSAVKAGDPRGFAKLYATYSQRLYRRTLAITRNPEDAEDVVQETFLRAHLRIDTFEGKCNIYTWLTRIAMNSALMVLRRRRARPETFFDPYADARTGTLGFEIIDSGPDPEQICDLRQREDSVLFAIRSLDRKLQEPIRMRVTLGSSLKEIGNALNISEAAVKARLHRARRRLSMGRDLKHSEARHHSVNLAGHGRREHDTAEELKQALTTAHGSPAPTLIEVATFAEGF